jgi:hypothetical protein
MGERDKFIKGVFVIIFCLGLFKPVYNFATERDSLRITSGLQLFEFEWDNDLFQQTDRYYTQGAHLYFTHPAFKRNPLRFMAWRPVYNEHHYSLSLHQEIFTPKNKEDSLKIVGDHPYAGLLYFRSTFVSTSFEKKLRLITDIDLGFTGPYTGAYTVQAYVHKLTNGSHPNGWSNQIKPMPVFNYNLTVQKGILNTNFLELIAQGRGRVGTVYDDLQVGTELKIGLFEPWFSHWKRAEKDKEKRKLQLYLSGGVYGKYVLYNAVLQGTRAEYLNNVHFGYYDIERFVGTVNMKFGINWNMFGANYIYERSTPEFKNGDSHGWSRISLSFRF